MAVHSIKIKNKHYLKKQTAKLPRFQKSTNYAVIKIFSSPSGSMEGKILCS
jgi:hypothetical protein